MATFKLGQRVHYVSRNGAEYGELTGIITDIYGENGNQSEDGSQYDVTDKNGDIEMAFSQELTLIEDTSKIMPRSSFTAELMLEDAIETFSEYTTIDADRVIRALTEIKANLKAEFDHQYDIEILKRGRR